MSTNTTTNNEKQADILRSKIPCPSDSQQRGSDEQLIVLSSPFFIISDLDVAISTTRQLKM